MTLAIAAAKSRTDFDEAAALCDTFAQWDVEQSKALGLSADEVIRLFHGETSESLAERYAGANEVLFLARWDARPAGCLAFGPYDEQTVELQNFFVDDRFRGLGIGRALMQATLAEIGRGHRRRILLHTAIFMTGAIAIYEAFGFARCARFRETPPHIAPTDVFFSRDL